MFDDKARQGSSPVRRRQVLRRRRVELHPAKPTTPPISFTPTPPWTRGEAQRQTVLSCAWHHVSQQGVWPGQVNCSDVSSEMLQRIQGRAEQTERLGETWRFTEEDGETHTQSLAGREEETALGAKRGPRGRGHPYTCGCFMLTFDRKQQNSAKRLSFN